MIDRAILATDLKNPLLIVNTLFIFSCYNEFKQNILEELESWLRNGLTQKSWLA